MSRTPPTARNVLAATGAFEVEMPKVVGVMTEDFRLYHDLVAELKAREIPFVSLSFSRRIPENVGVIVTSPKEGERIRRAHVVADADVGAAIARGLQVLRGKTRWEEGLVGIHPGAQPGGAGGGGGQGLGPSQRAAPGGRAGARRQA